MSDEAANVVRETLMAIQPPGNPLSFKEITRASVSGKGRNRVILAELVMFDDQLGQVKLEPSPWGWSVQWVSLPGGAISLENGQWRRVAA